MSNTLSTRVARLEANLDEIQGSLALILAALNPEAPAKVTPARKPAKAKDEEFVTWLRDTAEARAARKTSNKEAAAWMRSKGLVPNGPAWAAVKAGERNVKALKAMQA